MTWLPSILPYVGGGVFGALFTYGVTWVREHRRTLDAYRSPQRQAIGDILTATNTLMVRELESRTALLDCVAQARTQDSLDLSGEQLIATLAAMGIATLEAERAFQVGTLTVVDAPCWEAMGIAYVDLTRIRVAMASTGAGATELQSLEEIERYVEQIKGLAGRFNESVLGLVHAANERVSPAENLWNRRRRRSARRRISEHNQQRLAADSPRPTSTD
ncbi:hypothetical protein [Mycolicibacterium palauense]|uniref:hypothetical protein n=1 Tax=Mycolicibacterium palauense TaxID=2034511 RepID=UPI000BFEBCE3|nr:hypothetical protein [Mycolicibacterium palauense]